MLPPELHLEVLEHVLDGLDEFSSDDRRIAGQLSLVSRASRDVCQSFMYERVLIDDVAQWETLLHAIRQSRRIASLIKTLDIYCRGLDATFDTDLYFLDCLYLLPSLEAVEGLVWDLPGGAPAISPVKRPILRELDVVTTKPSPLARWFDLSQLQSLTLVCDREDEGPNIRLLEGVSTRLCSLSLDSVESSAFDGLAAALARFSALTELRLAHDTSLRPCRPLDLASLFPALQVLAIEHGEPVPFLACGHPTVTTICVWPAFHDEASENTGFDAACRALLHGLVSDVVQLVGGQPGLFPALRKVGVFSQQWPASFFLEDVDTRRAQAPGFTAMARELRAVGLSLVDEYGIEWDKAWDVDFGRDSPSAASPESVDSGEHGPEPESDDELGLLLPTPASVLDGEQGPAPGSDNGLVMLPAAP